MYPVRGVPRLIGLALLLAAAGLVAGCSAGQPEPAHLPEVQTSVPPHGETATGQGITQIGVERYNRVCAPCHGVRGDRIPAVPLQSKRFLEDKGEAALIRAVSDGRGLMPGWSRTSANPLSEGEIKAIVSYVLAVSQDIPYSIPTAVPTRPTASAAAKPSPSPSAVTPTSFERLNPPPNVPHRVQGREDMCLQCHGLDAAYPYPVAHLGRPVASCTWCHQPGPTPPAITHELQGRDGRCNSCHSVNGILRLAASHDGRRDSCTTCHERVTPGESAVMLRVPSVPNTHPASVVAIGCLNCHKPGSGAPIVVPTSHSGLTESMCLMCHKANLPAPKTQ